MHIVYRYPDTNVIQDSFAFILIKIDSGVNVKDALLVLYISVLVFTSLPAQPVWRRTRGREVPGSILACSIWFIPWHGKLSALCAHWAEHTPLFAHKARPTPLKV